MIHSSLLPLTLLLFVTDPTGLAATDTVTVYDAQKDQSLQRSGEIVSYAADELKLRLPNDQVVSIPGDRIEDLSTQLVGPHIAAQQAQNSGEFGKAIEFLNEGLKQERRVWVREMMIAEQVRCDAVLNNNLIACQRFLRLYDSNPQTPYFHVIPLAWAANEPDLVFEKKCQEWIDRSEGDVEMLLGASWMLTTRNQYRAEAALKELLRNGDPTIALLARTQLWRREWMTTTESDVESKESEIVALPRNFRPGPTYLLAQTQKRLDLPDHAVINFMRLPILYPHDYRLVLRSLEAAEKILLAQGDHAAVQRIAAERKQKYGSSSTPKRNVIEFKKE